MNKTSNKVAVGLAALASAGLASVCCLGPLALTALGLGGVGLAAGLTRYRPVFLGLTAAVLAVGFYLAYRKRESACAAGSCEVSSGSKTMKAALWSVTALALALATFPNWAARVVDSAPIPAGAETLMLKISGMDCATCTISIKEALERVPGVRAARVDFAAGQATVAASASLDPAAALAAVAAAGYKAEVLEGGGNGKRRS